MDGQKKNNKSCIDMKKQNKKDLTVSTSTSFECTKALQEKLSKEEGVIDFEDEKNVIVDLRCSESWWIHEIESFSSSSNSSAPIQPIKSFGSSRINETNNLKMDEVHHNSNNSNITIKKYLIPKIPKIPKIDIMMKSKEIELDHNGLQFDDSNKVDKGGRKNTTQYETNDSTKSNSSINSIFRPITVHKNNVRVNELNEWKNYFLSSQQKESNYLNNLPSLEQTRNHMINIRNMILHSQLHNINEEPHLLEENDSCSSHKKKHPKTIPKKRNNFKFKESSNTRKTLRREAEQASPHVGNKMNQDIINKQGCHDTAIIPPPKIRFYNGVKVTMIDEERKIFVIDLLNERTCMLIRNIAEKYVESLEKKCPNNENRGWRTLYTYTKMDLPCSEIKGLAENITNHIMNDVVKIVGEVYGKKIEASYLRPRSWKEPHLLKYQKYDGEIPHTGIQMHYDGCDITWQAMLTRSDEYEGGGTYMRCIQKTIKLNVGQILVHPGELYHKGVDINHGTRFLLVCFMDGFDPKIADNSAPNEDSEEYEKNIILV